jgi:hypothetical protein
MITASPNVTLLARCLRLTALGIFFLITVFLNSAWRGIAHKSVLFAVAMTVALRITSFCSLTGAAVAFRTRPWSGD